MLEKISQTLLSNRVGHALINPSIRLNMENLGRRAQGKRVLVTGASYGLGEAVAKLLAASGATVVIVARTADKLEKVARSIRESGGTVYCMTADLTDQQQVETLLKQIDEELGGIDIFVNNAGKSIRRSISLSYDRYRDFQRTMDINFHGPVRLMLGLLPGMRERGEGQIVNISTIGVRVPPAPRWAAYQSSKGAFDSFFRSVDVEARRDGVLFSSIYMALIYTRMSSPTPAFREGVTPGFTPEQAAKLVGRVIAEQKRVINPWWAWVAELSALIAREPVNALMSFLYSKTEDTTSASGTANSSARGGE